MLSTDALIHASMKVLVDGQYLRGGDGAIGTIDPAKVEAIGGFLFGAGILRDRNGDALAEKPDFSTWFTNEYLPG